MLTCMSPNPHTAYSQSIKCAEIEVSLFNAGKKEEFMQQKFVTDMNI